MTKNGQNWPKNMVFGLFLKITSLVLSGIFVKWKFLWFINIPQKLHAWGESGSQVSQKCLPANEISVFFNRQYFTNRWISDFDFWHIDRHEWKKQGSLTSFLKKNSHLRKWAILGSKIAHPHNSGSAGRTFSKFYTMKGANR